MAMMTLNAFLAVRAACAAVPMPRPQVIVTGPKVRKRKVGAATEAVIVTPRRAPRIRKMTQEEFKAMQKRAKKARKVAVTEESHAE